MYKAVVQFNDSDPARAQMVLRNVENLRRDLGPASLTELVVHGPGVRLAIAGNDQQQSIRELLGSGVAVVACRNSLNSQQLTADSLIDGVTVVSSGVGHLVRRQYEGWAYLRP